VRTSLIDGILRRRYTQIDFMFSFGLTLRAGAETILDAISKLNRYAAQNSIPLISTMDAHSEDDPEFQDMAASLRGGYRSPAEASFDVTRSDRRIVVPNTRCEFPLRGSTAVPIRETDLRLLYECESPVASRPN